MAIKTYRSDRLGRVTIPDRDEEEATMSEQATRLPLKRASQVTIDALNAEARDLAGPCLDDPNTVLAMLTVAASNAGFEVASTELPGACTVWVNRAGQYVNEWVEGQQSERLEEGGLGFDDQVEWYEEYLAESAALDAANADEFDR